MEQPKNLDGILNPNNPNLNQQSLLTSTTNTMTTTHNSTSLIFSNNSNSMIPNTSSSLQGPVPLYSLNNFSTNLHLRFDARYSKVYCPRKRIIAPNCRKKVAPYYIPDKRMRIRTKSENNIDITSNSSLYLETLSIINSIVNNSPGGSMMIDNSSSINDPMDTNYFNTNLANTNLVTTLLATQPTTKQQQPLVVLKRAKSLEAIQISSSENLAKIDGSTVSEKSCHEMEFVLTSRIQKLKVHE